MDKQHIADGSSRDREEHLPFPYMECSCHNHRYKFRESVWCGHYIYISKTVNDQHTEYRRRQEFPKILHECRSCSFFTKNCKRQETCEHCPCHAESYSYYLLCNSHISFPHINKVNFTVFQKGQGVYKYKIECQKCGKYFFRQRYNKNLTRHYRCGICGGKLKAVKVR